MPTPRIGVSRRSDVTATLRADIESGRCETRTLAEMLAVDLGVLVATCLPAAGPKAAAAVSQAVGIVKKMQAGGAAVAALSASERRRAQEHPSDIVRGWTCYAIALRHADLARQLAAIRPLADDAHMGVREWAWMAVRNAIAQQPQGAITLLAPWADDPSERIRRFASEATRPRGVWCTHIAELIANPALGLPILAPLRADPALYVQKSVGNWLNDASKKQPEWVTKIITDWRHVSRQPATERIAKRALRTLTKVRKDAHS